jgi:hypothetical protein
MTDDIAKIAASLSKAQRAYLTVKAEWRDPTGSYGMRWMTFPPRNTHDVLMRSGLVDGCGLIRENGLAVRAYLQENTDAA